MNRSNNERYQETQRQLMQAFARLLERKELPQISVSELCRECGIHRSSSYLHFQDVYDLMEQFESYLTSYYFKIFSEPQSEDSSAGYDIGGSFLSLFRFIEEHKRFYRSYWFQSKDLKILDIVIPEEKTWMLRRAAEQADFLDETELQYHQLFFKSGLAAIIGFWLSRDCPESPEALLQVLEKEYPKRTI